MKILVISTPIFKLQSPLGTIGYSGLEVLAWQQAAGLARKGHDVSLVAPDGSECPGVTILPIGAERTVDEKMAYAKYWQHLPSFDCIIDNSWNKWSYSLKQEGRLKAPILGVCHAPVNTMYNSPPPVDKPCIVCISDDQKHHWEALHGKPARRVYNGVDMDFYKSMEVKRSGRFLFLARFSTIKGPDLAIEACRKAGVGLDLVGDTSITNEPEFLQKCRQDALSASVSGLDGEGRIVKIPGIAMAGPASRGEAVWWFSQAHCLLHPNLRFREPMGLAPVESQACMSPVIAWRYGALKETVLEGETGFLVDSLDRMVELISSKAIDSLHRNRCREWVASKFALDIMIRGYEELCEEAIQSGGW